MKEPAACLYPVGALVPAASQKVFAENLSIERKAHQLVFAALLFSDPPFE